ncbi:restriction endonuclease subunit S [Mycoplasma sp. B6400]
MQKEKLVPAIRFSGYHTEWNLKTLEQIAKITFGQSPLSIYYSDKKTDHILVQGNADVKNRWVYPRIYTSQITKTAFVGDIIFSVRAPVGSVAKTNYDIVIGRGVAAIKGDNFIYFNLLWKEISRFWESKSSGSTFDSITSLELAQSEITIPSDLSEQQKIGQLFSNLDSLIGSQVLKLEKLQTIKQSLLNKMFASYDQKMPEIRFKIFNREWKISRLSEFGKCLSGYGFPISEQGNQGGIPFYKVSDMNINENYLVMNVANNYVSSDVAKDKGWKINSSLPAILFAKVGAAVMLNRKRITFIPFLIDNNMMSYSSNGILDNSFLYYIFYRINLPDLVQCGALPSINASDVLNMQVLISDNIYEQQKIGQFFSCLDSLIHSQEQKLEKLNNIKQALLEKMFC